jgi:Nucleotidyl transferase AbiEii toxin, Type IV TA system
MEINIGNVYKEQIKALNDFAKECFPNLPNHNNALIRFGGGTALAIYYFQHRRSFDIDLFVTDPQIINYLSPKHWLEDSRYFNTSQYIDQANHIRVLSKNKIKVDILVAQDFINAPYIDNSRKYFECDIYVESIEDILAKKIVYRRKENKTRDIIDIGIAIYKDSSIFNGLLAKGAINDRDVSELYDAILRLNLSEYHEELEIVEPFGEYYDIAIKAPDIIKQKCETR